jgi:hypothetical protein
MLLQHGTTRVRAELIQRDGPNPRYVEMNALSAADGFSTAPAQGPFAFGDPAVCARNKARLFPYEGGPAILEFELPDDLADQIIADLHNPMQYGKACNWGDEIAFDVSFGIEALLREWPQLTLLCL